MLAQYRGNCHFLEMKVCECFLLLCCLLDWFASCVSPAVGMRVGCGCRCWTRISWAGCRTLWQCLAVDSSVTLARLRCWWMVTWLTFRSWTLAMTLRTWRPIFPSHMTYLMSRHRLLVGLFESWYLDVVQLTNVVYWSCCVVFVNPKLCGIRFGIWSKSLVLKCRFCDTHYTQLF